MNTKLRIALYQPDIPGNTGAVIRTAACFGLDVDIVEPAGFDLSDRALKRSGMDYVEQAAITRHLNWEAFETWRIAPLFDRDAPRRLGDHAHRHPPVGRLEPRVPQRDL